MKKVILMVGLSLFLIVGMITLAPEKGLSDDTANVSMSKAESVGMSTERLTRIGVGMRRLIDAKKIPGTVTLVARKGQVVHFETNGLRNVETGAAMT